MRFVYKVFGMTYTLELSTRPAKALGDHHLWDLAEEQLAIALNEFAGENINILCFYFYIFFFVWFLIHFLKSPLLPFLTVHCLFFTFLI